MLAFCFKCFAVLACFMYLLKVAICVPSGVMSDVDTLAFDVYGLC